MSLDEYIKALREKNTIESKSILEVKAKPPHPGKILKEEFIKPLGITQSQLAKELNVNVVQINQLINKKRGITANLAIKLAKRFNTTPEFWMSLQMKWDLWKAYKEQSKKIKV
ncbi:MAG: HigA family addiction module antitoxin [Hydrogenothermaceae bacterium]